MPNFPTVSKTQIENALLDLRDRYREVSPTDLVYHNYARDMYVDLGDFEQAKTHQKEIEAIGGRDILSDCKACTVNSYVTYLVAIRDISQAIAVAQPLLNGSLSCHSVPQTTFARLIPEFLLLGRHDEAMGMASKLLKKIKKEDRDDYARCYSLLGYMAVMKKYAKGISIFKDHFEHAWRVKSKWGKFHFYAYSALLFREVLKKSDIKQIELTLPANFPLYSANNQYDINILLTWLEKEVQDLVAAFNKRNGNIYFSTIVEFINSLETVAWN